MLHLCYCCGKRLRFWQKKSSNKAAHKVCKDSYDVGYETAKNFAADQNTKHRLPTPSELYGRTGSVGEFISPKYWRFQKFDWTRSPLHDYMKDIYPSDHDYDAWLNRRKLRIVNPRREII